MIFPVQDTTAHTSDVTGMWSIHVKVKRLIIIDQSPSRRLALTQYQPVFQGWI